MNYLKFYRLIGKNPVPCHDVVEWASYGQNSHCHVNDTTIGQFRVSTIFLGVNHNLFGNKPILFETATFHKSSLVDIERYETWDEAEEGHARAVERLKTLKGH